jgi:PIN domain nuclease of toxin-antitoxin system
MRLLLDTQVALWWLTASPRLSKESRALLVSSPCAVSVASVWEVHLKHRLGKLPIAPASFRDEMKAAGATILPVTDEHVLTRVKAAESHRDPFDRLLLSVAKSENLLFLTADAALIAMGRQEPRLLIRDA